MSAHFLSRFSRFIMPFCIFLHIAGTSQIPTMMLIVITRVTVTNCEAFNAAVASIPIAFAVFSAAIASYEREPTTLKRSHGRASPNCFERAITLITIATAGAMVKTLAVIAILRNFFLSMPISTPRFHAFTRKNTDCAKTTATIIATRTKIMGWLILKVI